MDRDELKRAAAAAALEYVPAGAVIGVGSGSTVAAFAALLAGLPAGRRPAAAVPASEATAAALRAAGVVVAGLGSDPLPVYIDGADEVAPDLRLIKGGGGAHVREKLLAAAAELFVCIADEAKLVERLGSAPLPLAVLPLAADFVAARLRARGAEADLRPGFVSDDGAVILDVRGLDLSDPERVEAELDALPGVLACGLFARRPADVVLAAGSRGVSVLRREVDARGAP